MKFSPSSMALKRMKDRFEVMQLKATGFAVASSAGNTCPSEGLRGMCGNTGVGAFQRVFPFNSASLTVILHCIN